MKITLFYFSGTGNTKWAVEQFDEIVSDKGCDCKIYSIEDELNNLGDIINKTELIGFAFPIYGANVPDIMQRFIEQFKGVLNNTIKKQTFLITTAGYIDAFGPFVAGNLLKRNGLKLIGYINLKISNNISTPKIKGNFPNSQKLKIRMDKSRYTISKLIDRLSVKKKYIRNIGFYLLPGIIIRKAASKGLKDNYLALSINKEKCCQCMLCVKNCPTKSIIFVNNEFNFLPSCTACMRCYNFCSSFAIYHKGKYADPGIYRRYRGLQNILK